MSLFTPKTITLPDGAEVLLRSPELDDAPRLLDYLDAIRRETDCIMWDPDDDLPDLETQQKWLKDRRDKEGSVVIMSEVDGQVISICGIYRQGLFVRVQHDAELDIAICKAWCDRGLGSLLMNELINWALAAESIEVVSLGVYADNQRAQALYHKFGFEVTGRKRWRFKRDGQYIDELIMSRWVGAPEAQPVTGKTL